MAGVVLSVDAGPPQPAERAAHINIDASRHAIAVQTLLKRAIPIVRP